MYSYYNRKTGFFNRKIAKITPVNLMWGANGVNK